MLRSWAEYDGGRWRALRYAMWQKRLGGKRILNLKKVRLKRNSYLISFFILFKSGVFISWYLKTLNTIIESLFLYWFECRNYSICTKLVGWHSKVTRNKVQRRRKITTTQKIKARKSPTPKLNLHSTRTWYRFEVSRKLHTPSFEECITWTL